MMTKRRVRQRGLISRPTFTLSLILLCKILCAQEFQVTKELSSIQPLDTKWEFVWNELTPPLDFAKKTSKVKLIPVSHSWKDKTHSDFGVGTYRLALRLAQKLRSHSILFPIINSSAKIWVNGELIDSLGICAIDRKKYKAKLGSLLVQIPSDTTNIELVVQVANFSYVHGGIIQPPRLGPTSILIHRESSRRGVDNFFVGSLIAMFIYHIILFFLYQRGKPNLFLALICLVVALRSMVTHGGSLLLIDLFPEISAEFWKKMEFFGVYALVAIFPLYSFYLFPQQISKKPIRFFIICSVLLCNVVVFTSVEVYYRMLDVCHVLLIGGIVYSLVVIIKAWRSGNKDASIIFLGILASSPLILLEIMQNNQIVHFRFDLPYLVEIGVLLFLFFQIYLLANHYAFTYKNLEQTNIDLEAKVEARTLELTKANQVQKKLLSMISHDIRGPINSLRGILNIYSLGKLSESETKTLIGSIEENMGATSMLMDNILHWTSSQMKGVRVSYSKVNLQELVNEHIKIFRATSSKKDISVLNLTKAIEIESDKQILSLVLRNLIANAIKFSFVGGSIEVRSEQKNHWTNIQVTDYGKGISTECLDTIFQSAESKEGTSKEKGTGLGLSLCYDYLMHLDAKISVKSELEKGTTFTVQLPSRNDVTTN